MKKHVYSFLSFSRVYENAEKDFDEFSEFDDIESLLGDTGTPDLYKESTDKLLAEIEAGTADGSSFLSWIDTVCDLIDSSTAKGAIMDKAKGFINSNIGILHPLMKDIARYPRGSAAAKQAESIKSRFTNITLDDREKASRAMNLQRKQGLIRGE